MKIIGCWLRTQLSRFKKLVSADEHRVMLIKYDQNMKIVKATRTQGGWIANWYGMAESWLLLLPEGRIDNAVVTGWQPYSGWSAAELAELFPPAPPMASHAAATLTLEKLRALLEEAQAKQVSRDDDADQTPSFGL